MSLPEKFESRQLSRAKKILNEEPNSNGRFESDKTPHDFLALGAFLSAMPLKWNVKEVHDEPLGDWGVGGKPQMRVIGEFESTEKIRCGTFSIIFRGTRIEVSLDDDRQKLFSKAMQQIESKEQTT